MWLGRALAVVGVAAMLGCAGAARADDSAARRYAGMWSAEPAGAHGLCRIALLLDDRNGRFRAEGRSCAGPLALTRSWEPARRGFNLRDGEGGLIVTIEPARGQYVGRMPDGGLVIMRPATP